MISVSDAENFINLSVRVADACFTSIDSCTRRIVREHLFADRPLPPFDRVAMDGVAIHYSKWEDGTRTYPVSGVQKAGSPQLKLLDLNQCFEVMTGAMLPEGCDCVIRYEDTIIEDGVVSFVSDLHPVRGQNIHPCGVDNQKGDLLVAEGEILDGPKIAVAASIGQTHLRVSKIPRIAIISTGDELIDLGEEPLPFQIRRSNGYAINQCLVEAGFNHNQIYHIKDEPETLAVELRKILNQSDVLILSGGVSMGKFDFIPDVLQDLKVKKVFHKIAQKPGKPMWFGTSEDHKPVFALPGNPVSVLVCFKRYVQPALFKMSGQSSSVPRILGALDHNFEVKNNLTNFIPVKILPNGYLQVVRSNGSGDFSSLAQSDGFVQLDQDKKSYHQGDLVPIWMWSH